MTAESGHGLWRRLRPVLSLVLTAVVVYFVGRALLRSIDRVDWAALEPAPLPLALAAAVLLAQHVIAGVTYGVLLSAFGQAIGLGRVLAVYCTAGLGTYVPGKVAALAGGSVLLARQGVRVPVAIATPLLTAGLAVGGGLVVAAPLLLSEPMRSTLPAGWIWGAAAVAAGLTALHPRVFVAGVNVLLRRLGRPPLEVRPSTGRLAAAAGLTVFRYGLLGVGAWLVARGIGSGRAADLPVFIGAAAAANVVGLLAVFAPAGIGVREGMYVLALEAVLGPKAALLAVLLRLIQTALQAALGGGGLALLKWRYAPAVEAKAESVAEAPAATADAAEATADAPAPSGDATAPPREGDA
jgi:hypothetical protein